MGTKSLDLLVPDHVWGGGIYTKRAEQEVATLALRVKLYKTEERLDQCLLADKLFS